MKKDVLIKILGVQVTDGDRDVVELLTMGSFCRRKDSFYIDYDESEATGFEGSHTTLRYDPLESRVTMLRSGSTDSQLIIESGRRHQCSYDTGVGSMTIGVLGDKIQSSLNDEGGDLAFGYSLDINTALASQNLVHIFVNPGREGEAPAEKPAEKFAEVSAEKPTARRRTVKPRPKQAVEE